MTINDLRSTIVCFSEIRVWDDNEPKELINPTPLYTGTIENLNSDNPVANEKINNIMVMSSVLVFFVDHK